MTEAHEIQGSTQWHQWRKARGGASELPALMGCSPWYPRTPLQLWEAKTGRGEVFENEAMRRGTRLEAPAREYLESVLDSVFEPQVCELGRIVASLDGLTFDGDDVLEVKVPAKGTESETWQHVVTHNTPPANYWWQVQQQLLCSRAKRAIFAVCAAEGDVITDHILCVVEPDLQAHAAIQKAWEKFFTHLDNDAPPDMTDADIEERSDDEWLEAAAAYREAKSALAAAQDREKAAKERLESLADGNAVTGGGVKLTRFWVQGSVDYKKAIPADVDIEQYRKSGRWQTRITEAK